MIPAHLRFRRLKSLVSIEQLLAHRGLLHTLRRHADKLTGACPIHHGDNPRAFVVSRSKNLWRCFTACDTGGDLVELVRRLDRASYREVAHYLATLAKQPYDPPVCRRQDGAAGALNNCFSPFRRCLPLDPEVDFLRHKAIYPHTARRFETGLYRGRGFLKNAIGIRLHDPQGRPLGYAARRLDPRQIQRLGKWKFPPRFPKHQLLYNFHRVRTRNPHTLVVVECPWGVMRLHQIAVPAVALLGTHLFAPAHQILRHIPRIILMMDADPAGRHAARRISQQMQAHPGLSIADIPDGLDPDQLSDQQLATALSFFL